MTLKVRIARCPRCGNSTRLDPANAWRPFCSERCKLIDLGAWISGSYAIPGESVGDEASQSGIVEPDE